MRVSGAPRTRGQHRHTAPIGSPPGGWSRALVFTTPSWATTHGSRHARTLPRTQATAPSTAVAPFPAPRHPLAPRGDAHAGSKFSRRANCFRICWAWGRLGQEPPGRCAAGQAALASCQLPCKGCTSDSTAVDAAGVAVHWSFITFRSSILIPCSANPFATLSESTNTSVHPYIRPIRASTAFVSAPGKGAGLSRAASVSQNNRNGAT